ncbi:hypothetical protein [Actinoplanes sp. NPDC049316]|uniref:hypothetical protein n=1 Tax=Actinoplanes sp. NPDC049316 TaxID=3154727 RepID=UPI0034486FE8
MSGNAEAIIDTEDGTFLVRDALADTYADQGAAARASRIPGSRGGRMLGASGTVLQVRCAHQYSSPWVRVEVLDGAVEAGEEPWEWAEPSGLTVVSGRIGVDGQASVVLELDAAPGRYVALVGHQGRGEMREAAVRVEEGQAAVGGEATYAAWQRLRGTEKYLVRLWPAS